MNHDMTAFPLEPISPAINQSVTYNETLGLPRPKKNQLWLLKTSGVRDEYEVLVVLQDNTVKLWQVSGCLFGGSSDTWMTLEEMSHKDPLLAGYADYTWFGLRRTANYF